VALEAPLEDARVLLGLELLNAEPFLPVVLRDLRAQAQSLCWIF